MTFLVDLQAIGQRVAYLRGDMSQADFAATLDVDRKTVGTWEKGQRLPDTRALLGLWRTYDADPAWVLTGTGFAPATTDDERELLALFRSAPPALKASALGGLQRGAQAIPVEVTGGMIQHANQSGAVQIGYAGGDVRVKSGNKKR